MEERKKKQKLKIFKTLMLLRERMKKKMLHEKNNQFPRVKKVDHDKLSPHQINE